AQQVRFVLLDDRVAIVGDLGEMNLARRDDSALHCPQRLAMDVAPRDNEADIAAPILDRQVSIADDHRIVEASPNGDRATSEDDGASEVGRPSVRLLDAANSTRRDE